MLQQACSTFADWQRRFPAGGLDYITVNVSSRQLMQQNFLWIVEQAVHNAGLKPCDLRLEITETALMDSPTEAAKLLRELREFGVKIYLDDFGRGYSSLSHLAQASSRRAQDRPLVREEPVAARPSSHRREHPGAGPNAQHQRGRRRNRGRRCRRASWSASGARTPRVTSSRVRCRRGAVEEPPRGQPAARPEEGSAVAESVVPAGCER